MTKKNNMQNNKIKIFLVLVLLCFSVCPLVKEADATVLEQITFSSGSGLNDYRPSWSPDGLNIAFSSNRNGDYDIWAIPSSGGSPYSIISGTDVEGEPAWSPNGENMAYGVWSSLDWTVNIYTKDILNNGTPEKITSFEYADYPAWSPDGENIAFTGGDWFTTDIYTISLLDGTLSQLTTDGFSYLGSWSPDGQNMVLFTLDQSGSDYQIYTMPSSGGSMTQLTFDTNTDNMFPAWSPNGKYITYQSLNKNTNTEDIWILPVEGGVPIKITDFESTDIWATLPSWSPDSTMLAFNSVVDGGTGRDIWIAYDLPIPVPEPLSLLFLGFGFAGLILVRKINKKRSR